MTGSDLGFHRRKFLALGGAALLTSAVPRGSFASVRPASAREGYAHVPGGRVWWRRIGSGLGTPLLVLHGGPGAGHDYLEPLTKLAAERPVIFYDQLGCGRSDKPDDPNLWQVERFVREIDALRRTLNLDRVILYGHSWGGWLAQEYMHSSAGSKSVDKLVLASTSASVHEFIVGAQRLLAALPDGMDARRRSLEADGNTDSPEYRSIVEAFYDRHVVHVDHPPAFLARTFSNLASSRTYPVMNGPNEFSVTGTLRHWDRRSALGDIATPTLVMTAEWDEVTLDCHQRLHQAIARSQLVVLDKARHLAMVEQPEIYTETLRRFLADRA
jgi:proline iminopeptidase